MKKQIVKDDDGRLLPIIREIIDKRATYGYRRITVLLRQKTDFLRLHFKMKQGDLARVLGVDEGAVSKWKKKSGELLSKSESVHLKYFFSNKLITKLFAESDLSLEQILSKTLKKYSDLPDVAEHFTMGVAGVLVHEEFSLGTSRKKKAT